MPLQRILDLVWMGKGACSISQAQLQLATTQINQVFKNSSVIQLVTEKYCKQSAANGQDVVSEELDVTFKDVEDELEQIEKENHSLDETGSKKMNGTHQSKHHFSTWSRYATGNSQLCTNIGRSRVLQTNNRCLHTSSQCYAITAEQLAKLEEIAKRKKSLHDSKNNQKLDMKQELSGRSKEKRVPSTRVGRVASFGGLAAGLMLGTVSEMAKNVFVGDDSKSGSSGLTGQAFLNDSNMERIVNTLCRVRGAALKLGQMLSIQDESIVDPRLLQVFDRVRQSADFMPVSQMKKVLVKELGKDWHEKIAHFEERPFAAASIGQVHRAVLHDGREVAMKIQYPGVAGSIDSDVNNLVTLLKFYNFFPEKFYIDNFIAVARKELSEECDYEREAKYFRKFRELLKDDARYHVPEVISELSTKRVITTEMITGVPLDKVTEMDQDTRNYVASAMLSLLMREIFEFHMMQTDPNWSNFFYNPETQKINLLDFGASREYSENFVNDYIEVVYAASIGDKATVLEKSRSLKFLTGYEAKVLEDAHVDAVMILGEPFAEDGEFDFSRQDTTKRIVRLVPTMLEHRLTAPPEESYSLHRKLSGGFLLASKLQSKFACRDILQDLYQNHHKRKSHALDS